MSTSLESIQTQLTQALDRIRGLEEQVANLQESMRWRHLVLRPHSWKRQLSLKQRNITVGQLVSTIRANRLSPEEASADLELPLEVIQEALTYFEENKDLIQREAAEERRYLMERGYALEPANLPR